MPGPTPTLSGLTADDYADMLGALLPRGPYWDRAGRLFEADDYLVASGDAFTEGRGPLRVLDGDFLPERIEDLIAMSLFTWRRALDDDPIAEGQSRQGWWADPTFGSRLYELLEQAITDKTLVDARQFAEEAVAWLVDAGIVAAVAVEVERWRTSGVAFRLGFSRPQDPQNRQRFALLWEA